MWETIPPMPDNQPILFTPPADKRVFVVVGAYGVGKTEFALNLALRLKQDRARVAMVDLDIVNPYFRSREKEELLTRQGLRVIAPPALTRAADVPAIPGEVFALAQDDSLSGVIDLGGDRQGARVMAAFAEELNAVQPAVWYVVNPFRKDSQTAQTALQSLRQIEVVSRLKVDGLVSNAHLMNDTDFDTLKAGAAVTKELSGLIGLPVICHAVRQDLLPQATGLTNVFPLTLLMSRPWEDEDSASPTP